MGVRDVDAHQQFFYVDGALAVSAPIAGLDLGALENVDQAADPLTIGANQASGSDAFAAFFAGAIDDVALYGSVVTATDVAAIYAAPDGICR